MLIILGLLQVIATQFTSELHLHYLNDKDTMAQFTFNNKQLLDFNKHVQPMSIFPNSLLENIHKHGNTSQVYISTTQGTNEQMNTPQHGVQIISNSGANSLIMVNQLSEVFRIGKHSLIYNPTYYFRFDAELASINFMGFEDGIHFNDAFIAQDPTDNVCVDTIEHLKLYLGCRGNSGIAALLEPNNIFKSSYLSVQAYFTYDSLTNQAEQTIVILAMFPTQQITQILAIDQTKVIQSCPDFDSEHIRHANRNIVFDLKQAGTLRLGQLSKKYEDTTMAIQKPLITQHRFCAGSWYSFESHIHQQITPIEDANITAILYFPLEFIPLYHTLQINYNLMSTFIREGDIKYIIISGFVPAQSTLVISIKFTKILKSFEEYPHDPERGQDLISTPIVVHTRNSHQIFLTNHQVTRQPYPDFSMPFNILTYTSLVLGYYFLQILGMAVDKFELNKPEKGSIAQRILRKLFSLVS